jgi:hypothetical protein
VLQAWLSLNKLRNADRFGAWLAGISLHICRCLAVLSGRPEPRRDRSYARNRTRRRQNAVA